MRLSRIVVGFACIACLVAGSATVAAADDDSPVDGNMTEPLPTKPEDVIIFRQSHYKWMGDQFYKGMKAAAAPGYDGDVKQFAPVAANMAVWVRRIPTVFPKGTETGHETKALPAIWSNPTGFEARATADAAELDKLSTVAASGDKAAFAAQYQATGNACGACHREFRAR